MYKDYLLGVLAKIISLVCFCLLSLSFEKVKISSLNSLEQFAIICLVGTIILFPVVILKYKKELKEASLKLYPIRALFSILGMVTWIEAVKYFGATESILVNYLTPIITIFFIILFKEERLKLLCILSGLSCYWVIFSTLQHKIALANYGFFVALLSSCFWASYEVICKKQTYKEHFLVQVFYTFLFAAIFLLPFSLKQVSSITFNEWIPLIIITILRVINVILLFISIKLASLTWLLPVSYMKLPVMAVLGFLLFQKPTELTYWVAAIILIMINIIMMVMRKREYANVTNSAA